MLQSDVGSMSCANSSKGRLEPEARRRTAAKETQNARRSALLQQIMQETLLVAESADNLHDE